MARTKRPRRIWGKDSHGNEVNHRSVRMPHKKSKLKNNRKAWKKDLD